MTRPQSPASEMAVPANCLNATIRNGVLRFVSSGSAPSSNFLLRLRGKPRVAADSLSALCSAAITALSFALILSLFFVHLQAALSSTFFTAFSLVEETAYTLISAQNFLKFGFLNSMFLQDFSVSPDKLDHPYVYDHMPAGPDITQALLLHFTNGSYETTRIIFSLTALVGFFVYYVFVRKFLGRFGLRGAGIALAMPGAWQIIQLFERQIYSPFCILCFLPLYMYLLFLETGKRWQLLVVVLFAFLSSIYLEYTVLCSISACWFGFFVTRLIPIRFWHFVLVASSIAAGVVLHLIQNLLYLGWPTFLLELGNTLSNRITGHPSPEELQSFYKSIGILHHGAHSVVPNALAAQFRWNFDFPGTSQIGLLVLTSLLVLLCALALQRYGDRRSKRAISTLRIGFLFFLRLGLVIAFSLTASILLFPAFSQEVTVRGSVGPFFFGIGAAAAFDYSLRLFGANTAFIAQKLLVPPTTDKRPTDQSLLTQASIAHAVVLATYMIALTVLFRTATSFAASNIESIRGNWASVVSATISAPSYDLLDDVGRFAGQPFMTDINVPAIGLFTRSVGFGVCAPESIQPSMKLDLAQCKIAMTRRYDYWRSIRPRYFFYTIDSRLFPGFADCLPANLYVGQSRRQASCLEDLRDRLSSQYALVLKNNLIEIYDLSRPPEEAQSK
jgi:hypothetical protein